MRWWRVCHECDGCHATSRCVTPDRMWRVIWSIPCLLLMVWLWLCWSQLWLNSAYLTSPSCSAGNILVCENHIHISLIKWYILRTFSFNAHWTSSVVQAYYIYGVSPCDLSSGSVSWLTAPARCWRACAELACANTLAGDTGAAAAHKFSSSVSTRAIHEISRYFLYLETLLARAYSLLKATWNQDTCSKS